MWEKTENSKGKIDKIVTSTWIPFGDLRPYTKVVPLKVKLRDIVCDAILAAFDILFHHLLIFLISLYNIAKYIGALFVNFVRTTIGFLYGFPSLAGVFYIFCVDFMPQSFFAFFLLYAAFLSFSLIVGGCL